VGPGAADNAPQCLVEDALERIAGLGGVEPHAAYGQPAEEELLALYSASLDLLVVGARGYGPVGRVIHGSTFKQLAHTALARFWCSPEPPTRSG
jgi:nucleotide-binding universal stress UspA family protein